MCENEPVFAESSVELRGDQEWPTALCKMAGDS